MALFVISVYDSFNDLFPLAAASQLALKILLVLVQCHTSSFQLLLCSIPVSHKTRMPCTALLHTAYVVCHIQQQLCHIQQQL